MSIARPILAALLATSMRDHVASTEAARSGGLGASPVAVDAGAPAGRPATRICQMRPPLGRLARGREMGGNPPYPPRR